MTAHHPLRLPSQSEIDAFERDGFVMLPGVLDPASLAPLEAACERLLATGDVRDVTAEAVRLATPARADAIFGAPSFAAILAGRGRFLVSLNTARRDAAVPAFALGGAVGALAAALLRSRTARLLDDVLLVKEPGAEEDTEWHDDEPFSLATGDRRCSLWVSLDDVSAEAGALCYLPGSQRRFAGWRERGTDADALAAEYAAEVAVCPVRRGDVVAHHPAVIHAAGPNHSAGRRRAFALRFAGDGARFVLPAVRGEERSWYGLADGEPLGGDRFPLAWPRAPR